MFFRRGEAKSFSISDRLQKRNFLRTASFGFLVVGLLCFGYFAYGKYFKKTQAANIPLYCQVNPATKITECLMQYDTGANTVSLDDTDTRVNNPDNPVNLIINGSATSQTLTVVVSGTFQLRNLTINNAKITHAALIAGTDFDINTNVLTAAGARKKVDFRVSEQMKITGPYGSIDVTGKGYPGGTANRYTNGVKNYNGYGPGAGKGQNEGTNSNPGGGISSGGGNYGDGGSSFSDKTESGCLYGSHTLTGGTVMPNPPGSLYGSGSGYNHGTFCVGKNYKRFPITSSGRAGGGYINVYANSFYIDDLSHVSADGESMNISSTDEYYKNSLVGGGAGGTISLKYSYGNVNYPSASRGGLCDYTSSNCNYDDLTSINNAKNGLVYYSGQAGLFSSGGHGTNIHANGGNSYMLVGEYLYAGAGGGGKVEVGIEGSLISVDKTYAYNSVSLSGSNSPINVAKGDNLKATLKVQNVEAGKFVDIRDLIYQFSSGGISSVTNVQVFDVTNNLTLQVPAFSWLTETISGSSYFRLSLKAPENCRELRITYDTTVI